MLKFSIIIPAYNVASYIERCLVSCMNQDIPQNEYELIVINDGSIDNTLTIAEEFANGHPFAKVISQENKGLSEARNAGLAVAKGDYVWFVDSDDTISPNCLGGLYAQAQKTSVDILAICIATVKDGIATPRQYYDKQTAGTVLSGPQMLHRGLLKAACAQFFICRRSYLSEHGFSFFPGVYHEDEEWTPRILYYANSVTFTDAVCYNIYSRLGSIMSTPNPKRSLDLIKVAESLHCFSEAMPKEDRVLISKRITSIINHALKLSLKYTKDDLSRLQKEFYVHRHLLGHLIKSGEISFIIEGCLLSISPSKSVSVYRYLQRLVAALGLSQESQGREN